MIKLIIFDLDGVLIDTKDIHFHALNKALYEINPEYVISMEDHLSIYDGLPTKVKLDMLGVRKEQRKYVSERKQFFTMQAFSKLQSSRKLGFLFSVLKDTHGLKIAVASNSVRETVMMALDRLELTRAVDIIMSNEDVKRPKPSPEMFLRCMMEADVGPHETLIVEDSIHGREAAINAGARLCAVNSPKEVTEKLLLDHLNLKPYKYKWRDERLNVLIPMAGAGSRFAQAGYTFPKPLIEVQNMGGKPMIQVVVENLNIESAHYIYIVQREHDQKYNVGQMLKLITPNCDIVLVDGVTEGAACTTLLAKHYINNDQPLLIANSDQFVEWDSRRFMYAMLKAEGGILTFDAHGVKWSFCKVENGLVTEVAEKNPISAIGTVGIYWWQHGSDYVKYAEQMIEKNIRTNGEFYVAPVFNEAIADGMKVRNFHIEKMWGLGDPQSLEHFIENYHEM